ncbi:ModE family transcriptional regulator [Geothermobacter hydrogeniphilus]|uniref:ModE family transcriptional regulator n=1 Tax=Geothermobacter hydrogeniphilus TaxID=1969733 RepID=A0A2K2HCE4_9BACT|nr:LysR family transcriptional regulator [Geothermobacter hydrogeniphilus]PNU20985.1 ModE family transcriptional regulator [Geothermobacter hydrogeniphilus]
MKTIRVRSKVWLEVDGEPLLGDGRERLLQAIQRTGSLNAAAAELGIPYRKVWSQLRQMEEHAPFPLVRRVKGGKGGGSTSLTEQTVALLARYARLKQGLEAMVDEKFREEAQDDL